MAIVVFLQPHGAPAQMAAGTGKATPPTSEPSSETNSTPKPGAASTPKRVKPSTTPSKSATPAAASKSAPAPTTKKADTQPTLTRSKVKPIATDEVKPSAQTGGGNASQKSGPPSPGASASPPQQYAQPPYGVPQTGAYPVAPYGQYPPVYGVPPQYAYPPRQGTPPYPGQPPYAGYPSQMSYPPQYPQGAYPPQYRPPQGTYPPAQTAYPQQSGPSGNPVQPGQAGYLTPSTPGAYQPPVAPGGYPQQSAHPKQPVQPMYPAARPQNPQQTTGNLGPDNKSAQKDNMSEFLSLVGSARQMITTGDSAFAVDSLNQAVALRPRNLSVYFYRGLAYDESGDPSKAVKNYLESLDRAKTVGMDSAELRINLGNSYMKLAFNEDAIMEYKRAIEIDPGNRYAHLQLGRAYLAEGKYAEALKSFRRCDSLGLTEPSLPYLKALALAAQGEKQGALGELAPLLSEETEKQRPELYKAASELKGELK